MNSEDRKDIIDIWKTIVGVQRHFNDISMRIRGMFVTILLATFAAIGFLLNKELNLEVGNFYVQFATVVPLYGVFITSLFYFIDRYWYHRLLVGSVKHAITIEKKYSRELPELSLSETIGIESPYEPGWFVRCLARAVLVRHDKFRETGKLHSIGKIEFFYKSVMAVLLLTAILVGLLGGVTSRPASSIEKSAPASSSVRLPIIAGMDVDEILVQFDRPLPGLSVELLHQDDIVKLRVGTITECPHGAVYQVDTGAVKEACP